MEYSKGTVEAKIRGATKRLETALKTSEEKAERYRVAIEKIDEKRDRAALIQRELIRAEKFKCNGEFMSALGELEEAIREARQALGDKP